MIELQKEFCDQIWNRYNPYTKLHYKDDPVFVMTEITNECDLFAASNKGTSPYYEKEFRLLFKAWLEENKLEYDWEHCEMYAQVQPLVDFKLELTRKYYREMYDYMRALGVKIPITGTNWTHKVVGNTLAQTDPMVQDILYGKAFSCNTTTLYTVIGDIWLYLCIISIVAFCAYGIYKKVKAGKNNEN